MRLIAVAALVCVLVKTSQQAETFAGVDCYLIGCSFCGANMPIFERSCREMCTLCEKQNNAPVRPPNPDFADPSSSGGDGTGRSAPAAQNLPKPGRKGDKEGGGGGGGGGGGNFAPGRVDYVRPKAGSAPTTNNRVPNNIADPNVPLFPPTGSVVRGIEDPLAALVPNNVPLVSPFAQSAAGQQPILPTAPRAPVIQEFPDLKEVPQIREPSGSQQPSDDALKTCCAANLGADCQHLCTYSVSFIDVSETYAEGKCPPEKELGNFINCASVGRDVTDCCKNIKGFSNYCTKYCKPNPSVPNPLGKKDFKCATDLEAVMQCFRQ